MRLQSTASPVLCALGEGLGTKLKSNSVLNAVFVHQAMNQICAWVLQSQYEVLVFIAHS